MSTQTKRHLPHKYIYFLFLGLTRSEQATALLHAACLVGMGLPLCGDRALGNEQTHLPHRKSASIGTTWLQREERCWRCVGGLIHLDNCAAEGSYPDVTRSPSVDAVWLN